MRTNHWHQSAVRRDNRPLPPGKTNTPACEFGQQFCNQLRLFIQHVSRDGWIARHRRAPYWGDTACDGFHTRCHHQLTSLHRCLHHKGFDFSAPGCTIANQSVTRKGNHTHKYRFAIILLFRLIIQILSGLPFSCRQRAQGFAGSKLTFCPFYGPAGHCGP